jgi:TRAP-type C4-dicarboxylate transport system substrate-binding protein
MVRVTTWTMHSCFAAARPEGRAIARFVERVEESTGGALKIAVRWFGGSGVPDMELLRVVPSGTRLQLATFYSEYLSRDAPELALSYVQGVLEDAAAHWRVFPVVSGLYDETLRRWGIRPLAALARPVYEVCVFAPEPVASLAALKGRPLRVWSAHQVNTFKRLGIEARVVPQNRMAESLKRGTVACALYMREAAAVAPELAQLVPHMSALHPFSAIQNVAGVSEIAWAALPAELKEAVEDAGASVAWTTQRESRAAPRAADPAGFLPAPDFPEEDRALLREAAHAAWAEMAEAAGEAAMLNRNRVLAALRA